MGIALKVFFDRSNSARPAPVPPLPFTNWLTMRYFPSGVNSRSSGEWVPQMISRSPWTPHSTGGGPAAGGCCAHTIPASKNIGKISFISLDVHQRSVLSHRISIRHPRHLIAHQAQPKIVLLRRPFQCRVTAFEV